MPISLDTAEARRLLLRAQALTRPASGLQSTGDGISEEAAEGMSADDSDRLANAIKQRMELTSRTAATLTPVVARSVALDVVSHVQSAMAKAANGESPAKLTDLEFASLEAIVEVTGRPAMRFDDGRVQMPPADVGDNEFWRVLVAVAKSKINKAAASVGRITLTDPAGLPQPIGTGWCCPGGLIVTNRHVVDDLVRDRRGAPVTWNLDEARYPRIEFNVTDHFTATRNFMISKVVYYASEAAFDVALLRVSASLSELPPPLPLEWNVAELGVMTAGPPGAAASFQGRDVYVIGHPYRPLGSTLTQSIFGAVDGNKRWSPGKVTRLDVENFCLEHDCSTLGGNSGSCVLSANLHRVVGIHFGGVDVDATGKGTANVALALSQLGSNPLADILRTGNVPEEAP